MANPLGTAIGQQQRARDRRFEASATGGMPRAIGGPAPDPAWDAFFGAIEDKGTAANAAGKSFGVDLVGRGGGGGIGALRTAALPQGDTPMDDQSGRSIRHNQMLTEMTDRSRRSDASMRILNAQARMSENAASESDWADDPYKRRSDTADALERQGTVNEFGRGEQVKDAANTGSVFAAGEPGRRMADWEARGRAREMYPFSKEKAAVDTAQIEASGKIREAETNRARESSAGLKALSDLARTRSTVPPDIDDPSGEKTGGFLGYGAKPKRIPNPAYGDLTDSLRVAQSVIGGGHGGAGTTDGAGKVMSQDDLLAFAESNRMDPAEAAALAKQHGWTIR